jgi:hypothetical protein
MIRAIVGDDIGLVKDVVLKPEELVYVSNQSGPHLEVSCLALAHCEPCTIIVGRIDGSLELFQIDENTGRWLLRDQTDIEEPATRIHVVGKTVFILSESCLTTLNIDGWIFTPNRKLSLLQGPYSVTCFVPRSLDTEFETPLVACVSADSPPVLIDCTEQKILWSGKNAPDTPLGLKSIFLTECLISVANNALISADSTGRLRFYDFSQKKPILEFPVFQAFNITNNYTGTSGMGQSRPIKHLQTSLDGKTLFIGDTFGSVIALDISKIAGDAVKIPSPQDAKIGTLKHMEFCRKLFPMRYCLSGIMGSIRHITVTEKTVYVVSAGRYAYAFDIQSKGKKSSKVFLKQKLTCCLPLEFLDIKPEETGDNGPENPESESDDHEAISDLLKSIDSKNDDETSLISKSKRRRLKKGSSKP